MCQKWHMNIAQSDPCHLINPSTIIAKSTDNKGWVSTGGRKSGLILRTLVARIHVYVLNHVRGFYGGRPNSPAVSWYKILQKWFGIHSGWKSRELQHSIYLCSHSRPLHVRVNFYAGSPNSPAVILLCKIRRKWASVIINDNLLKHGYINCDKDFLGETSKHMTGKVRWCSDNIGERCTIGTVGFPQQLLSRIFCRETSLVKFPLLVDLGGEKHEYKI